MDSNDNKLNGSQDSAMNLTPEEIDALFAQMQAESEKTSPEVDLDALFEGSDGADDLDIQEISKLLDRADNNEAVDTDILTLMKSQEEEGQTAYDAMDLFSGEPEPEKKGFFAKLIEDFKQKRTIKKEKAKEEAEKESKSEKKEKKPKKKKAKKQTETEELFDYEKLEDAHFDTTNTMDDALALLMGDNSDIDSMESIPSIDKEPEKKKEPIEDEVEEAPKKDKKKKDKKAKDKKPKEKKVKEKKPKKVKPEKRETEDSSSWMDEVPNKKKTFMIFAASIMVMAGFLIISYFFTRHVNNKYAEEAFESGNYLECYQTLYNQDRNEEQDFIFHRSEITLKLNLYWNKYHDYMESEKWLEGLDKLVQYVYEYPEFSIYAQEWNCSDLAEGTYQQIQLIFADEYDITVQDAMDIAGLEKDEDYTRALLRLVQKRDERMEGKKNYPDMLPQEEDKIFSNK